MQGTSRAAPPRQPPGSATESGEVRFPLIDGRRSTTATCRAIIADAARAADPGLAGEIEACERWRGDYVSFMGALTALAADPAHSLAIAGAGLDSMRRRLVLGSEADDAQLSDALAGEAPEPRLGTGVLHGAAAPVERLEVPYRGHSLHGPALSEQLDRWVRAGTVEASFATAIELVAEHPEWLSLPGRTIALIGAGSEIGPLEPLCAWGAEVLAVDLPSREVWARVREVARRGSGTVRMPVSADGAEGLDVLADLAETRAWLAANIGASAPVLGMYGYADGGPHVLLTAAFDVLAGRLAAERPGTTLAYLATPTDAYLVPEEAVERARARYRARRARRLLQAPFKALSGGRLYRPAYTGAVPVADALVAQQGPNYAVAKRLQRWRGVLASAEGEEVSFNVAPATWTKSVTKNRVLAAAYAGAGRFGVEIFEPSTTRSLMAALLVHDLHHRRPRSQQPEQLFSDAAAHGGLWTAAYEPRSVLGLAALAGLPSTALGRSGRGHSDAGDGAAG